MKHLKALLPILLLVPGLAAAAPLQRFAVKSNETHRYLVERTFPPGALEGLDAAGKARINSTNARFGVRWVTSYANAAKTRTYCVYEGPTEAAVRNAADANRIPVDAITEIPVTLSPN